MHMTHSSPGRLLPKGSPQTIHGHSSSSSVSAASLLFLLRFRRFGWGCFVALLAGLFCWPFFLDSPEPEVPGFGSLPPLPFCTFSVIAALYGDEVRTALRCTRVFLFTGLLPFFGPVGDILRKISSMSIVVLAATSGTVILLIASGSWPTTMWASAGPWVDGGLAGPLAAGGLARAGPWAVGGLAWTGPLVAAGWADSWMAGGLAGPLVDGGLTGAGSWMAGGLLGPLAAGG